MNMNVARIVDTIKKENRDERLRIQARIIQAFKEVERLKIDFLKIDDELEQMILFGSLVKKDIGYINFDIDIGLRSKKYYQLVGRALENDFKVDVVDLDSVNKRIKDEILKNGKVIYEKK